MYQLSAVATERDSCRFRVHFQNADFAGWQGCLSNTVVYPASRRLFITSTESTMNFQHCSNLENTLSSARHSPACKSTPQRRHYSRLIHRTERISFRRVEPPRLMRLTTSAAGSEASTSAALSKASEDVETGLKLFKKKQYKEALRNFQTALESQPRPEESQAALYNSACCQVKLKQWQEATESVSEAINNYSLPLKTAMEVIIRTVARMPLRFLYLHLHLE